MFRTLLIPFDLSEPAISALRCAQTLADRADAALVVLHGMIPPLVSMSTPTFTPDEVVRALHEHLEQRIQDMLAQRGIDGRVTIRNAPVQEWIDDVAKAYAEPMVLLSRHGYSGKAEGIGSNARRILKAADVPVWLHPGVPGGAEIRHIVAAVGFDDKQDELVRRAAEFARAWSLPLKLVYVVDTMAQVGYFGEIGWVGADRAQDAFIDEMRRRMDALAARVAGEGIDAKGEVLLGSVPRKLADAAAEPGTLLVVGKHSRSGLVRFLVGSTPEDLTRTYAGSLLVVP